jgi:2-polyprenyl-3-methyl-5-hydroxy-6-metoxy-1,4-benzoquinol methylase
MANQGWTVAGIEYSQEAATAASRHGYKVHAGPLESAPSFDIQFDLIVGWMVLEHLHDPVKSLQKLRRWIKPNGLLVVSVPNCASWEFRFFKENWYGLHLPAHLYHFTPRTLGLVLNAGGWAVRETLHHRLLTNFLVSTGYVLRRKGASTLADWFTSANTKPHWHYTLFPLAWLLSTLGQTGRMTVVAEPHNQEFNK